MVRRETERKGTYALRITVWSSRAVAVVVMDWQVLT